ncbi:hypothetical protein QJQ45_008551 [Haematococcus lacustris]|nr:hypothetical protein QJQ45_008551 [Haematococcus lacustris]
MSSASLKAKRRTSWMSSGSIGATSPMTRCMGAPAHPTPDPLGLLELGSLDPERREWRILTGHANFSRSKVSPFVIKRRLCRPVNAMVTKKRGVMARCAGAQKAREVMAQRRAAEAEAKAQAGAAEAETQAQADAGAYEADEAGADEAGAYEADAGAYEAEAQAQADARAYEAQLHQLQPELQQREQQATDTQRLQHLQQQLQDLQQDELQRKEQQVAEEQQQLQQQQADMHLREQQLAEQQHQLQQQQADMHKTPVPATGNVDTSCVGATWCWTTLGKQVYAPMPMFQDTVKEVYDDEECYALLMWFHPDLLHDEVCFGKLTNTHCARYCQHMGLDRPKERRKLRRLVVRDLRSEQLEFEYEVNRLYG